MAPVIIGLTNVEGLSTPCLVSIILPPTLILTVGLIQPAKGAILALQWWFGMNAFKQERPGLSVNAHYPRSCPEIAIPRNPTTVSSSPSLTPPHPLLP